MNFILPSQDPIEKRGMNKAQINYIIDLLKSKKNKEKNNNFNKTFEVQSIGDIDEIFAKNKNYTQNKEKSYLKIVDMEDMFETCMNIHKKSRQTRKSSHVQSRKKVL